MACIHTHKRTALTRARAYREREREREREERERERERERKRKRERERGTFERRVPRAFDILRRQAEVEVVADVDSAVVVLDRPVNSALEERVQRRRRLHEPAEPAATPQPLYPGNHHAAVVNLTSTAGGRAGEVGSSPAHPAAAASASPAPSSPFLPLGSDIHVGTTAPPRHSLPAFGLAPPPVQPVLPQQVPAKKESAKYDKESAKAIQQVKKEFGEQITAYSKSMAKIKELEAARLGFVVGKWEGRHPQLSIQSPGLKKKFDSTAEGHHNMEIKVKTGKVKFTVDHEAGVSIEDMHEAVSHFKDRIKNLCECRLFGEHAALQKLGTGFNEFRDQCVAAISKQRPNILSLDTGAATQLWKAERDALESRIPDDYKRVCDEAMTPIQFEEFKKNGAWMTRKSM